MYPMGREFPMEGTAAAKALLQRGLGVFKGQLGGQWGESCIRGKTVDEMREIVGPRPCGDLKASVCLE